MIILWWCLSANLVFCFGPNFSLKAKVLDWTVGLFYSVFDSVRLGLCLISRARLSFVQWKLRAKKFLHFWLFCILKLLSSILLSWEIHLKSFNSDLIWLSFIEIKTFKSLHNFTICRHWNDTMITIGKLETKLCNIHEVIVHS